MKKIRFQEKNNKKSNENFATKAPGRQEGKNRREEAKKRRREEKQAAGRQGFFNNKTLGVPLCLRALVAKVFMVYGRGRPPTPDPCPLFFFISVNPCNRPYVDKSLYRMMNDE
ncbi:MAG: hypothetical protein NT166_05300 [Candidatus Aminicenantes bacterium]|nr:hypothetical protein [Candidatus Aminicenantes bacterium]